MGARTVSAYAINANGSLTAHGSVDAGAVPTSIVVDPSGSFVYVANYDSGSISGYAINKTNGSLTELPDSPFAFTFPGYGPHSIAVNPKGGFIYAVNEYSRNTVAVCTIETDGALTPVVAPPPLDTNDSPFSVAADPSGSFVYAVAGTGTNSGEVLAYAIAPDGTLTAVGSYPTGDYYPTSVAVDPSGSFVYVTNQVSDSISVYAINKADGSLTAVGSPFTTATDSGPYAIAIVAR
ncbi:MAG: lactonase family protein [Betaproteobacteria bacterium]|nr:lactonase family protein [Betaproteobacteria bacterium]